MKWACKKELERFFEAPPPLRKREFLQQLEQPRMGILEFILLQLGYIRKWIWGISALVFAVSVIGAWMLSMDMLWNISALTPLLSLTILAESGRSDAYGMAELELAARFSLRSVLLARLGILGTENLLLLCLLFPIGAWNNVLSPIRAGVYIITPFLLTTWIGLFLVRKFKGQGGFYFCVGAAVCVSLSIFFFRAAFPQIYEGRLLIGWVAMALFLCVGTARQCLGMIKQTEELSWSL